MWLYTTISGWDANSHCYSRSYRSSHGPHHAQHGQAVLPPPSGEYLTPSRTRNLVRKTETRKEVANMESNLVGAPFYAASQPGAHPLPTLAGLGQPPTLHATPGHPQSHQQQQQPPGPPPPSQVPGYALPTLGQAMQHQSPTSLNVDREREMREREARDREARDRQRQQEEVAQRDRELQREHEQRERQQREQQQTLPLQSQTGSIPIHQPVASRIPTSIHGPNGLLSHLGTSAGNGPPVSAMSVSSGSTSVFGGHIPAADNTPRSLIPQSTPGSIASQQMIGFGATPGPHSLSGGVAALPQGQQPILNVSLKSL